MGRRLPAALRLLLALTAVTGLVLASLPVRTRLRLETKTASLLTTAPVLMVGDSISHRVASASLCGEAVFNASIPGDRVADLLADAPGYAARLPARRVVIAIGVNDAWPRHRSIDAWIEDYGRLVARYAGHDLVLVEIYPPDPKVKGLAGRLDLGFIAQANAAIRRIAATTGAHLVSAPEHLSTADGLHPSASGSHVWRGLLARAACP